MTEHELRVNLSRSLTACRKRSGLTQAALAEKLNYSDKTISKWERGEGLPDLTAMQNLSEIFGVPVDALMRGEALPQKEREDPGRRESRRRVILLLSVGLCWLTAAVVFFILRIAAPSLPRAGLSFLYAVPASAIVCTVFGCLWWTRAFQLLSVSALIWSVAASLAASLRLPSMGLIYIIAAVLQVLLLLWFRLLQVQRGKRT